MSRPVLSAILAALALSGAAQAAFADPFGQGRGRGRGGYGDNLSPNEAHDAVRAGRHVPLRVIIAEIDSRWPGRMLPGAELQRGDPPTYVIEWLTNDGRRLTIIVNAESGAVLGVSGG